eukprot:Nitzschia sp. Nitz4//scaffold17_size182527//161934//162333//NITZ4_001880-RA/size182527-snap-gene-0.284-mRNA-1//1//CDS//3329539418//7720//frame0
MCSDLGEGSRCCAGYSVVGALFTLWVGVMLATQPFFIGGIEDAEEAKSSAFGAAGMFACTFVASVVGIWYDNQSKSQIESSEGGSDYQLAQGEFPNYGGTTSS